MRELRIRWYCINCMQKGIAGITIKPEDWMLLEDLLKIIKTTCHTDCYEPDIRLVQ